MYIVVVLVRTVHRCAGTVGKDSRKGHGAVCTYLILYCIPYGTVHLMWARETADAHATDGCGLPPYEPLTVGLQVQAGREQGAGVAYPGLYDDASCHAMSLTLELTTANC